MDKHPSRDRRTRLKAIGLSPNFEEHLTEDVFCLSLITDEAQEPAIDLGPILGKEGVHRQFVAVGDTPNEEQVRRPLRRVGFDGRERAGDRARPNIPGKHV